MTEKRVEVFELMKRKQLFVLGVQETKWKGDRAVNLGEGFKMLHAGGEKLRHGRSQDRLRKEEGWACG